MLLGAITGLAALGSAAVCALSGSFESMRWLWLLPVSFAAGWIVLTGLAFVFVVVAVNRVDQQIPQEKDSPF